MGKATNIYLTDQELKQLKKLSQKKGLTVSEIIRRAIDEYFEKQTGGSKIGMK